MSDFSITNTVVDLVRLGFHGFAIVILYLGYRLLRSVVKSKDIKVEDLKPRLKEVRIFMAFSLIFLFGGASLEMLRGGQKYDVHVIVTPAPLPSGIKQPILTLDAIQSVLDNNTGTAKSKLRDGASIHLHIEPIIFQFQKMNSELQTTRAILAEQLRSKGVSGGGFDDGQ
jgi:hypothetical protein